VPKLALLEMDLDLKETENDQGLAPLHQRCW
jgi:hypothetical protein